MAVSIFDVTGPVMVGPSSSHTAGAARLARTAAKLCGGEIARVTFGLCGSFWKTYSGHGTDRALLAGVMGFMPDDERIRRAETIAGDRGLSYCFYEAKIEGVHENTAVITMYKTDGTSCAVTGSSIGGGRIRILDVDGYHLEMSCERTTVLSIHRDRAGVLGELTGVIGRAGINIAALRCFRGEKDSLACCVIETDEPVPEKVEQQLVALTETVRIAVINREG
ncbi:MAG: L-serine ammonia-lyase, iron-sulfur-dependent subunit beta [Oscillospiraceae bacterium]|nr:L-serine ammonia-lyase, iron-sulfur-dependent subunit beta [Oscillospiraceae bacterium]